MQELISLYRSIKKNAKPIGYTLLGFIYVLILADWVILPLYPVAPEWRAEAMETLTDMWPEGIAWLTEYRVWLEVGVLLATAAVIAFVVIRRRIAIRNQAAQNERLAATADLLLIRMNPDDASPIEAASNLFLALRGAMTAGPKQIFKGEAMHASLEIMSLGKQGKIGFLVWTPQELKETLMLQIQSNYPEAMIETMDDPLKELSDQPLTAVEVGLMASSVYPIRTDFGKGDPLTSLINALIPNSETVAAGIQFVFRPADTAWQTQGAETVNAMRAQLAEMESKMIDKASKVRLEAIEAKKDQMGYEVTVRLFGAGPDQNRVKQLIETLGQYGGDMNGFTVTRQDLPWSVIQGRYYPLPVSKRRPPVLNVEEFAAVWHPPGKRTPSNDLIWSGARFLAPPLRTIVTDEEYQAGKCRIMGHYKYPNGRVVNIGWRRVATNAPDSYDATTHGYVLGPTGSGKSTILLNAIMDDIEHGCGIIVMEPHDDLTNSILERVPKHRWGDVVKLDAADMERPFGFNFMECPNPADRAILTSTIMGVFKKVSGAAWGVMMEETMEKTLLALLETQTNATMYSIYNFMTDIDFREKVLIGVKDPITRRFWMQFDEKKEAEQQKVMEAPLRRLGKFLGSPLVRNIVSQPYSTIRFRHFMDSRKIILINLSTGTLGEENAALMGALFVSMAWRAAASRREVPESQRIPTYFWIDEFQNYVTPEIAAILAEARKFGLGMCFANQFYQQVVDGSPIVAAAIKGNCGSKFTYKLSSPDDINLMLSMFGEPLTKRDLNTLPKFTLYARMMSHKEVTPPFTVMAPKPRGLPEHNGKPVVLNDENDRRLPPRRQVSDEVTGLVKQMARLDHDKRVEQLAALSDNDFAMYQQVRQALDWKKRNELLKSGGRGMTVPEMLTEASRLTIGTPAYEVEAIQRRSEGSGRSGGDALPKSSGVMAEGGIDWLD